MGHYYIPHTKRITFQYQYYVGTIQGKYKNFL